LGITSWNLKDWQMRLLIIFLIFCIFIPEIYSLGVSPPLIEVDYVEGKTERLSFGIRNSREIPITVVVTEISGELADYIEIEKKTIEIPPKSLGSIGFKLYLNSSVEPGLVSGKINILDTTKNGEGMFQVGIGVTGVVRTEKPYPGIYPVLNIGASDINEGDDLSFYVTIINKGLDSLKNTMLISRVRANDGSLIDKFEEKIPLISGKGSKQISYTIPSKSLEAGAYTIRTEYFYGDEIIFLEKEFRVGSYDIILEHYSKELYDNGITPIKLFIKSNWNEPLNDVYSTIKIKNKVYRSLPSTIPSFGESTLTVYVDNDNFKIGELYNANITIHHDSNSFSYFGDLTVINPELEKPVLESPQKSELSQKGIQINVVTIILISLVVLLIVINAYLLGQKKSHKKK
jgi:hypothetical protein